MAQHTEIGTQAAPTPEEAAWFGGTEASATQTVLFVEDEAFVRGVASEVLRSAGYRVLIAGDAGEAARAYEAQLGAVDLLLSDVILPGENGRSLAARLRRTNPKLKVLLITGYVEQMEEPTTGVAECLAKPFSVNVLLQKVKQVLERAEAPAADENWVRRACGSA
jgi:two-component system, cell cycle sensor histidine kinase and response regulator CckA